MKQYRRLAIAAASLAIVLGGTAALAHQGGMQGGMGGMHGQMGGMQGGGADHEAIRNLMTQQEREAMREKMHAAKSPEERQAIAAGMRTEMEKRAKEKGITLPERHAGMGGHGGMDGHGGHGGHGDHGGKGPGATGPQGGAQKP